MEPTDPGQGQEKPSEQNQEVALSSRGRQRRANPKYSDFETGYKSPKQKTPRRSSRGGRAPSKTTPAKSEDAINATQHATDGEKEATEKAAQESDGKTSEETPQKAKRAKRTPSKKTPAKKTPAKKTPAKKTPAKKTPATETPSADGGPATGEGGAEPAVQQENEAPKRKYVRKPPAQNPPVTEAPAEEAPVQPQEEAVGPGGRRRRSAATAALKYLQILAKEVFSDHKDDLQPDANSKVAADIKGRGPKEGKARRGRKRKRRFNSDDEDDEDFVPVAEEDEDEQMEDEEEVDESDLDLDFRSIGRIPEHRNHISNVKTSNGLAMKIMASVWSNFETTKKFREDHYSSWVFPEWIPSTSNWHPVDQSDVEKYLPQELRSAAFKVSREGLAQEEEPFQSLSRFEAVAAHRERWDMLLYAGGPIWAMEWCPTPDGAPATQYIALACHRGMDDQHCVNMTYAEPGLIQLWDMGKMEFNSSPDSQPALAYGLAQDKGFVWSLKWCPAGGWELPSCARKAPFLPRLGLLAAASSTGVVTIYSLPHPAALLSDRKLPDSGNANQQPPIYQPDAVLTLKLGSLKAPRHGNSGQVLSMDWLPEKPHNVIAIGFYDGVVGLWDLSTKSTLLQVRESDRSLSLLPFRCVLAHDHAVRALAFCPASRHLLATAGEDRYIKTWDLKRLDQPVTVQKRHLTNEIYWPLNAPGYLAAQDAVYVAKGSHGVHFFDHYMQTVYAVPRTGSLWSLSYSDWLNSVLTADSLGEVIFAILPPISCSSPYIKHSIDRRFPVYLTSLVPRATTDEEHPEVGGAKEEEGEEEGEDAEEREGGDQDPASERGDENDKENGGERGRVRNRTCPSLKFQTYKEAVRKYSLQLTDSDMGSFVGREKQACWKHMKDTEFKTVMNMDEMPLAALHKVRFNPNMSSHTWAASGGQTGLVRLNCLRSMISPNIKSMVSGNQAQFDALYSPAGRAEPEQL